ARRPRAEDQPVILPTLPSRLLREPVDVGLAADLVEAEMEGAFERFVDIDITAGFILHPGDGWTLVHQDPEAGFASLPFLLSFGNPGDAGNHRGLILVSGVWSSVA